MIAKTNPIFKLAGVVFTCAAISACSSESGAPSVDNSTPSSGDADFSKFVSIGDSLTAGYADGALYLLGQQNSFPSMLAAQFSAAGGGDFEQPLVGGNLGGLLAGGDELPHPVTMANLFQNRIVLNSDTQKPERLEGMATEDIAASGLNGMMFNNMGVPGAKSFHLGAPGYGNIAGVALGAANPYFVRFTSDPAATVIGDAAMQQPSFVTLWIGNNDVLSFATSGGFNDFTGMNAVDQKDNTDPASYGRNDITDPGVFGNTYNGLIAVIKGANPDVKGVLINIPDVKSIPYFTTVPFNPVPLDQATADVLNMAYADYNAGLQNPGFGLSVDEIAQRTINFVEGQNAVVITDETLNDFGGLLPKFRQTTADDLIVLPAGGLIGKDDVPNVSGIMPDAGKPWGLGTPLTDAEVLIPDEIAAIDVATAAFNAAIKAAADADDNFIYLDMAAVMDELKETGIDFGTGSVNSDFATGGAFSLDGVHPTARGYAVISNVMIDAINVGFNANVHNIDPADFSTVFLK